MEEIHDNFVNLVFKMIELQDQYFDNGKHKIDLIRYKKVKKEVKDYILKYKEQQRTFYCEKNLDTEGIEKCKFQCDNCFFLNKLKQYSNQKPINGVSVENIKKAKSFIGTENDAKILYQELINDDLGIIKISNSF